MRENHVDDLMARALDERLSAGEMDALHAHLETCARCREEWARLCAVDVLLKREPTLAAPEGFAARVMTRVAIQEQRAARRGLLFGALVLGLGSAVISAWVLAPLLGVLSLRIGLEVFSAFAHTLATVYAVMPVLLEVSSALIARVEGPLVVYGLLVVAMMWFWARLALTPVRSLT